MDPPPLAVSQELVILDEGTITFECPGDLARWRVETLYTKEPETIAWIDGFSENQVFWDVGANMGIYSLYAAVRRKAQVLAFEPAASNYHLLNRNIEINGLSERISAYCLAFNDMEMLDRIHMQMTGFAGSMSAFGNAVDNTGSAFKTVFHQGMLGLPIDTFIERYQPPFPHHLKIDVDSIEDKIIKGGAKTLADPRLLSLSVELDSARTEETEALVTFLTERGLVLESRRQSPMFAESTFSSMYNYLFRKQDPSHAS